MYFIFVCGYLGGLEIISNMSIVFKENNDSDGLTVSTFVPAGAALIIAARVTTVAKMLAVENCILRICE